jgi:hypothetical protein
MSVQFASSLLRRALTLSRILTPAVMLSALIMGILVGCGASSSAARPAPLQVVSAAITMNPSDYNGACSGKQDITFTAKLSANPNNLGGAVHYRWRIGYSVSDGVITFEKGETAKTLTRAIAFDIVPEADPYLAVAFATTQPNVVAAPETRFDISCSVPLTITAVDVTMQPWTAGCGPHAFGFAAVLTAPAHNAGGEARYVWRFGTGTPQSGKVMFAPGQTTQTVVVSQTYNIQRSPLTTSGAGMASDVRSTTEAPTATPGPSPTPVPNPTQPPSPWPKAGPGQVYAVFSVTAPNAISNNAWATIYC